MKRLWLVWMISATLAIAACGEDTAASSTSSSTSTSAPSSTTTSTTMPDASDEIDADCSTAYGRVAFIELFDTGERVCRRVGDYQEFVVVNRTSETVDLTWSDSTVSIQVGEVFQPGGAVSDHLDVGVHRIQTNRSPMTIEVVDPERSRFTDQPMLLRKWADIRPGDSVADAESRLGVPIVVPVEENGSGEEFCEYGFVESDPYSPGIMIHEGTQIVRLDAYAPQHQTASGIRIGSTTDDVLSTYQDKIERRPHEYANDGEYLVFVPVDAIDADYRVVFETNDDGVVTTFRNGLAGPVSWVEGCL
ncbi:MAG: hypothetical protein KJN81_08450 [Acidimicrobiia bacterium]|nr:hypothetical protein [Acidimicrobiia bacterium]NNL28442.1 hypothetical protein [Acidimicrobiia bacterium]